jgi:hypothetical protein
LTVTSWMEISAGYENREENKWQEAERQNHIPTPWSMISMPGTT